RRERTAPATADFEGEPPVREPQPGRDVQRAMHRIGRQEWRLRILLPGYHGPRGEPERQCESGGAIHTPSVSIADVKGLTEGSGKCDGRERHPPRAHLELLRRPAGTEPRDSGNRRRAPRLAGLEDRAGYGAT